MTTPPSVDDLRLVSAVVATGSVGAAARVLQVSQPSASQRLARLERRLGVVLFDRDTQGARPTPAGRELGSRADHVLGHLDDLADAVRAAAVAPPAVVGTIASLAAPVFAALAAALERPVQQRVDHGTTLLAWLAEGTLDVGVLGVAEQVVVPRGLPVHPLGDDRLVLALPAGVEAPPTSGRTPLRGRRVPFAPYDGSHETIARRLAAAGAEPLPCAAVPAALAIGARLGLAVAVPRTALPGDPGAWTIADLPWRHRQRLSAVTRRDVGADLVDAVAGLGVGLGLEPVR